eukprot:5554404-Pleurochrysis_carterae.AAC.1
MPACYLLVPARCAAAVPIRIADLSNRSARVQTTISYACCVGMQAPGYLPTAMCCCRLHKSKRCARFDMPRFLHKCRIA